MTAAVSAVASLLGGPSPFSLPAIWDSISFGLGAYTWSGKIEFRGARRHFSWQHKQGPGRKGTVDTFRGTHTHPFEMVLYVIDEAQWQLLPGLLQFFNYDDLKLGPDGLPLINPIDISHPALQFVGIHQVLCEWIEAPMVRQEREGDVLVRFGLHEFIPVLPQNVTKTPIAVSVPTPFINNSNKGLAATISDEATGIQVEGGTLPNTLP